MWGSISGISEAVIAYFGLGFTIWFCDLVTIRAGGDGGTWVFTGVGKDDDDVYDDSGDGEASSYKPARDDGEVGDADDDESVGVTGSGEGDASGEEPRPDNWDSITAAGGR